MHGYTCRASLFNTFAIEMDTQPKPSFAIPDICMQIAQLLVGKQACVYVGDLSAEVIQLTGQDSYTLRDWVRACFAQLGMEVEFSGKGKFEKGVLIDLDTNEVEQAGLNPDRVRFGQTLVRVKEDLLNKPTMVKLDSTVSPQTPTESLAAQLMRAALLQLREHSNN